jgi:O-antigen ligase
VANGIAMTLGMCAALMSWPRLNRPGKLLLLALLPVFAWGVYNTFTRSVWMGASASLVLVVALATPRSWRVATLATTALIGASVLAVSWGQFVAFKRDRDVSVEDVAESAKLRPILAAVAWQMFLDRPLVGCGFGQYAQESRPYLADRTTDLPLEKSRPYVQHNVFLAPLVETGLVGLSLFVALLASWLHTAWRLWRAAWAPTWVRQMGLLFLAFMPAYLVNGMFHDVSIISQVNMLLFFLAGGISGLTPWLEAPLDPKPLRVWKPEDELVTA